MKRFVIPLSRYILAALFIFSGFVKSVDPMGTAIKIREYMLAFHFDVLTDIAPWLSVLLCGAELLLGLLLLTGIFRKTAAYATLLFMSFFTLLTLYILIASPVSDCGCFGEAVSLSNSATFIKNLIFTSIAVFYTISIRHTTVSARKPYIMVILLACFSFGIPIHALSFLPVIDFLPYKTGTNIPQAMHIPDDAPKSEYKTTLIYKNIKTGAIREFELEDTTWYDSGTWEYIDTKNKTVKQGYIPPISHFNILDRNGEDRANEILSDPGDQCWLILPEYEKLSNRSLTNLSEFSRFAATENIPLLTFTGQDPDMTTAYLSEQGIQTTACYNVDPTTLKSMIRSRSHTGVLFIREGTILAKWNATMLPSLETTKDLQTAIKHNQSRTVFFYGFLILCAVALIIYLIRQRKL